MKEIYAFHMLNDFSGSPKVLKSVLEGLYLNNAKVTLSTSDGGCLDDIKFSIRRIKVNYAFSKSFFKFCKRFIIANLAYFFIVLKIKKETNPVIYINTILPFGAAIAAKIKGFKILYHYHENAKAKGTFYRVLCWIMIKTSNKIISVSRNQAATLPKSEKIVVIANAIPETFENVEDFRLDEGFNNKRILMLCSLKKYKGINEFWKLAELMPHHKFDIIINDIESNIKKYFEENGLNRLPNLKWYPRQSDIVHFYLNSSIIVNLSNKNEFIETFGLTAIEAIACGRPIIGPTVGGISEIIQDGFNGYKIDSDNLLKIKEAIEYILSSKTVFSTFCKNSLSLKPQYSGTNIINQINNIICTL